MTGVRRLANAVVGVLTGWGLVPHTYQLTTRGRKTGRPRTTPVTVVDHGDERWLVAPYGAVSWVLNIRTTDRVALCRRRETHHYEAREVSFQEAGPILKEYLGIARATRPYFRASKDSTVDDFIAEADRHPVFALTPTTDVRPY